MRMTSAPLGATDPARMTPRPIPSPGNDWLALALVEEEDCYDEWRDAAAAAADAFRRWAEAPVDRRALWFLAYAVALGREESAAAGYAVAVAEVERRLQRGHGQKTAR
jgi:acyl-CoA reductase-like NAD-dependent aldehyde dehydrogenase